MELPPRRPHARLVRQVRHNRRRVLRPAAALLATMALRVSCRAPHVLQGHGHLLRRQHRAPRAWQGILAPQLLKLYAQLVVGQHLGPRNALRVHLGFTNCCRAPPLRAHSARQVRVVPPHQ
jgi:hypothetical protein